MGLAGLIAQGWRGDLPSGWYEFNGSNGAADDTAAAQTFLNSLPSGGHAIFQNVTKVTSPLVPVVPMTVEGGGYYVNRILAVGCSVLQVPSGLNNFNVKNIDLALATRYTTTPNTLTGIQILGASNAHPSNHVYDNVHIDGFKTGLEANYLWSSKFSNVRTGNGPLGIVAYGSSVNNEVAGGTFGGASIAGSRGILLAGQNSNSDATPCSSQGWDIHGGSVIDSFEIAIEIVGNNTIRVRGLTLDHNLIRAVYIRDSGGTVFSGDIDLSDNYMAVSGGAANAVVEVNNTVNDANFNWINSIKNNYFEAYTGSVCPYGLYISGAYSLCDVAGNSSFGMTTADFRANIAENTFSHNRGLSTGGVTANFYSTVRQYATNNTGSHYNPGYPIWCQKIAGVRTAIGTAAPTAGTIAWAVGDRVVNSTPAVGSPKAWVCTVAGAPGTWVSEGNL